MQNITNIYIILISKKISNKFFIANCTKIITGIKIMSEDFTRIPEKSFFTIKDIVFKIIKRLKTTTIYNIKG